MKYDKGDEKLLRKLIFFILFQSNEGERRRYFSVYSQTIFLSIVYNIKNYILILCEIIVKGAIMNSLKN